jgi:hypothetical protein
MDKTVMELLSFPRGCLLVPLMMLSSPLTELVEQRVPYSHHIQQIQLQTLHRYKHLKMAKQNFETQPNYSSREIKQCFEAIIPVRSRIQIFQDSLCAKAYVALEGTMTATSGGCRCCVQCSGKVTRNVLLKWRKRQEKA